MGKYLSLYYIALCGQISILNSIIAHSTFSTFQNSDVFTSIGSQIFLIFQAIHAHISSFMSQEMSFMKINSSFSVNSSMNINNIFCLGLKMKVLGQNRKCWMHLVERRNRKCIVIIIYYFIKQYKVIL